MASSPRQHLRVGTRDEYLIIGSVILRIRVYQLFPTVDILYFVKKQIHPACGFDFREILLEQVVEVVVISDEIEIRKFQVEA